MKPNSLLTLTLIAAACFAESGVDAQNGTQASNSVAQSPAIEMLLALDKQANEAYFKSDTNFFESLLSENFVMRQGGQRLDKAATLKMIAGNKCDVKTWSLDEPWMSKIDTDTYNTPNRDFDPVGGAEFTLLQDDRTDELHSKPDHDP